MFRKFREDRQRPDKWTIYEWGSQTGKKYCL